MLLKRQLKIVQVAMIIMVVSGDLAFSSDKPVKKLILPGESFLINDRPAFILWPENDKRKSPQPWVFYGPTLPGLPDQHEKWMHEQFLNAGLAVVGIDVGEAYGNKAGQSGFTQLYQELTENHGFAAKPCLLGRSRGGLLVSSWAISNPDKVAGLAGIYPVFDLQSYPGLKRAATAFEMPPRQLEKMLSQLNPVARIQKLAENSIPIFMIHGDVDKIVPLESNSLAVVRAYEQLGKKNLTTLIIAEGQGHNFWKGFFHSEELIQFVIQTANGHD